MADTNGKKGIILRSFKAAFPYTIPIFAGFWFLGLAYGIYECFGLFICLSNDHEPCHIRRIA